MDDLHRAEALIRAIDPLMTLPVYIIDAKDVDDERLLSSGWIACTGMLMDLQLRPTLERLKQWRGRGFGMIIHPELLPSGFRFVAGCVLHEYSHFIEDYNEARYSKPIPRWSKAEARKADEFNSAVANFIATSALPAQAELPRWSGHGIDFVRIASHLAYRANRIFESIKPKHLRSVSPYHPFGSEDQALEACSEELDCELPLIELLRTPPPSALVRYWERLTN
jgi:hypothetical protein